MGFPDFSLALVMRLLEVPGVNPFDRQRGALGKVLVGVVLDGKAD